MSLDTYRGEKTNPHSLHLYSYCYNSPVNFIDPSGHWVVSAGMEVGAAFVAGLYLSIGVNYDGKTISISRSLGALVITNVSAYAAAYFAYYPSKKNVNKVNGVGISTGVSFSVVTHFSAVGAFEVSKSGSGFSASLSGGAGMSIVPIPYWEVKFSHTKTLWKKRLTKVKNGKTVTKKVRGKKAVKITKKKKYTAIQVVPIKKTIRMYNNKEVEIN